VQRWFDEAQAAAAELGVALRLPNPAPKPRSERRCDWPWRGAYVAYSGEAMPCCMVATPDRINFGSMATQGVRQVWDSDAYRDFRRRLDSDAPPDICRGCAVYQGKF
jgi:radical SAM protein with 4Fe4S-binding SPASM domain